MCAFFLAGICAQEEREKIRDFDPCQTEQTATLGSPYVIGFAYLPGGDVADWEAGKGPDNRTLWRNPCKAADRAALGAGRVITSAAVYSLKVTDRAMSASWIFQLPLLPAYQMPARPSCLS
jgi:hypothetical protein